MIIFVDPHKYIRARIVNLLLSRSFGTIETVRVSEPNPPKKSENFAIILKFFVRFRLIICSEIQKLASLVQKLASLVQKLVNFLQ